MTDLQVAREAANQAADEAESVIMRYWSSGEWTVTIKEDASPVTEADLEVESRIHQVLAQALPEAGFFGEETGNSAVSDTTGLTWLVDPIDGTKSFIRGMRYFSTQIALESHGELVVGVSNAPIYQERLVAVAGQGSWLNGRPVHCRASVSTLENAFLSIGNIGSLASDPERWSRFGQLVSKVQRVRGYGDFCHYHQLCCGQTDLVIESDVNILDIAALTVAVRASGGIITDLHGDPVGRETVSVLAAGSEPLHEQALRLLLS